MKTKTKKVLSLLLSVAMVLTMLPLSVFAGSAPTTNTSGLSVTFVTASGGSDNVDKVDLTSALAVNNDVFVKIVNMSNQTATLSSVSINNGLTLTAQSEAKEIEADGAAFYKVTGKATSNNYTATVTVGYTLDKTYSSGTAKQSFTSKGYIHCEYKATSTSAELYVQYDPWQAKNRMAHRLYFDETYANSVWLTATGSGLTSANPDLQYTFYVDREKATSWAGIGLKYQFIQKYENRPKWECTPSWTTTSTGDIEGSFSISGIKDGTEYDDIKTAGQFIEYDCSGTVPLCSSNTNNAYVFDNTGFSYSCNSGFATYSTVKAKHFAVNVYSYNKSSLRSQVSFYERLGLNNALYSTTTWNAYTSALSAARKALGTSQTTQYNITNALNALSSAYTALTKSSYCVTVTDKFHNGDKTTAVSAANTATRYFIRPDNSTFTAPYSSTYTSSDTYNKADKQITVSVSGNNPTVTYEYWTINFDELLAQLHVAEQYLDKSDIYSQESYTVFTTAYEAAKAIDTTVADAPESQSVIDTATENLRDAIANLEENADYTRWNEVYATIPSEYFTNKELYFTTYTYTALDNALALFPGFGMSVSKQGAIDEAADAVELAVQGLKYNAANTAEIDYYLNEKWAELDLYGSYTYDGVEYFKYSEASLNEFDAVLDEITEEYQSGTWDIRDQETIDALTLRASEAYTIPLALMNEEQANTIGSFIKDYEEISANPGGYCDGSAMVNGYTTAYDSAKTIFEQTEYYYAEAKSFIDDELAEFKKAAHVFDTDTVVKAPTCTDQGYTIHFCINCGDSYKDNYVEALGHDYVENESLRVEPNCLDEGTATYVCSRCNVTKTEPISALGHDYVPTVTEPTCTDGGYTTYVCSRCNDSYVSDYTEPLDHDYKEVSRVVPNCTDAGSVTYKCNRCGNEKTEDLPALGHDYVSTVTAPDCTHKGYTTYVCSRCNATYVDDYVDELGHNYEKTVTPPDCIHQGYTTYTCTRGDSTYTADEVPALGHQCEETVVPPTITEEGYTLHQCIRCDYSYKDSFVPSIGSQDLVVTFVNYDNTVISVQTVKYGQDAQTPEIIPTRPADNMFTYEFKGWDTDYTNVTKNITVKAEFIQTYIAYTVKFVNDDGSVISTDTYHYGDKVTEPETPKKPADNRYTYTFTGWDRPVAETVTGNATYRAQYSNEFINYTVTFADEDGSLISSKADYHYGEAVEVPAAPTKEADNTYTYEFAGWDRTVTAVSGDVTYTATYTATYIDYTVKFVDEDGTVISTKTYHYGDKVEEPEAPSKAADNTYTYEFAGWDKAVTAVDGDVTYTATYSKTAIGYTVKFVDEDGTVLSSKGYNYGDTVEEPEAPVKAADNTYTYEFAGWDKEVTAVNGDATYTATYKATYIDYTVKFAGEDGTVISTKAYHYGDTVEEPEAPAKAADNTYTYEFAGWDKEVTAVNGDVTYTATYKATYIDYTVKFADEDGKVISTKTYHYGDKVEEPEAPSKAADNTYTYEFTGWDKEVTAVNGDVTYTATYKETYIDYTVKFVDYDDSEISSATYHYGDTVAVPENPTRPDDDTYCYEFAGWDKEVTSVDGNVTYKATYTKTFNTADYGALNSAVERAQALNEADYTPVSYARVTKAVEDVVYGLKLDEQSRVDAMAEAIVNALDSLVSTTEYDEMLANCLAVNNDNNAYTADSYNAFKNAMAEIDTSADFNTESAKQSDVDAAYAKLADAYALLKASYMAIVGENSKIELDGETVLVTASNTNAANTDLQADDGGANIAYLEFYDAKGNKITNNKKTLGTGCRVELKYNGAVVESHVIVVLGDVNGDGQVTVADIIKTKSMVNSTDGFTKYQIEAAKCGTDEISVDAVTALAKRV